MQMERFARKKINAHIYQGDKKIMAFGVALPITYDSRDGFRLLYGFGETIKQNFKMLLLTIPGERVMEPDFGVGIMRFLFSLETDDYRGQIKSSITEQVAKYMPVIQLQSIDFYNVSPGTNSVAMRITYSLPDVGVQDLIEFTI